MNQPKNTISAQSASTSKHALEARLKALQDKGRLAIHVWEHISPNGFSRETCDDLTQVSREYLDALDINEIPIQSVSLLPTTSSSKSMRPWCIAPYAKPMHEIPEARQLLGSYLLNLDQAQASPPLIVRADSKVLFSGAHVNTKDVSCKLCQPSEMRELYRRAITDWQQRYAPEEDPITFYEEDDAVIDANIGKNLKINRILRELALADTKNLRANKALDLLATEQCDATGNIIAPNEVAVSATMDHVEAIAVPLYMTQGEAPEKHENYTARMKLWGALSGLEHITQGYDLPVVFYHVSGPNKGQITLIGQGKEELRKVAAEALQFLRSNRAFKDREIGSNHDWLAQIEPQISQHHIGIGREFP